MSRERERERERERVLEKTKTVHSMQAIMKNMPETCHLVKTYYVCA